MGLTYPSGIICLINFLSHLSFPLKREWALKEIWLSLCSGSAPKPSWFQTRQRSSGNLIQLLALFLNYQAFIIEILETTHIVKTPKYRHSSDRKRCYTYIVISQLSPCKWNHIDQLSKKCWMIFLRLCLPNLCDEVSLQGKPKEVHFSSSWIKRLQTKGSPESFESHKVTFLPKEHEASIE